MKTNRASTQAEYEVEAIIGKEARGLKTFYLVQLSGYLTSENSWELLKNLQGSLDLVRRYEKTQGRKLKAARKTAYRPFVSKKTLVTRSPRRYKRSGRRSSPSSLSTKTPSQSPSFTSHLKLETWYLESSILPKPQGVVTRPHRCLSPFMGSFDYFEVDKVLGTLKNAAGRVQFEVSWKPRFGITPGKSFVTLLNSRKKTQRH